MIELDEQEHLSLTTESAQRAITSLTSHLKKIILP